ncbi:MAG: 6-carboxytetrahydropterin synthase QueD [Patescibacteria group bacterium]|jgi:6-pyruvoyltetrahydropterin/6-carboxytetrahydropterin synthase
MLVTKSFYFESAHKLEDYDGKCKNLHGHSYRLEVTIEGKVNENGMVMDFSKLKKIVNEQIIDKLDHSYSNDIIKIPTAENTLIYIWSKLKTKLPLYELKLWETRDSYATYRGKNESN